MFTMSCLPMGQAWAFFWEKRNEMNHLLLTGQEIIRLGFVYIHIEANEKI